jgi:hypothetical protein
MNEDIEFYDERRDLSLNVLSLDLIRQLASLIWRVLKPDARSTGLKMRILRSDGLALVEGDGQIQCFLINDNGDAAYRPTAKRRLFSFEAPDLMAPGNWRFRPEASPDLWYNTAVTILMPDPFLDSVDALHSLRAKVRAMTPEQRARMFAELGDDAAAEWVFCARDAQLPPPDLGWCWLYLGASEQENRMPAPPPSTSLCAPASPESMPSPPPLRGCRYRAGSS